MTDSDNPKVSHLFGFSKIKLRHLPRDTAVVRAGSRIVHRQEYLVKSELWYPPQCSASSCCVLASEPVMALLHCHL